MTNFPRVSWDEFKTSFRWRQGEHLAAVAPTGAGKTTLFAELMPYRRYSIMLGTKPADKLYDDIIKKQGFRRVESITEIKPWDERILLWPKPRKQIRDTLLTQKTAFKEALDVIVAQNAWTVWVDEAKYMSEMLGLRTELTYCLEQLRSIDATIICGAQRPAWLPRSVLANSSHIFIWKTTDREDAKRLSDIGGIDSRTVMDEAKTLGKHEFIYIKTRGTEAKILRSQVGK